MSATSKARGGQASELTKLKLLAPEKQEVIWSWREELENNQPLTNAQIRNRIARQYGIRLSLDKQLSEFWRWYAAQQDLEESNDLLAQFDEFMRKQNPGWSPDKLREVGIAFFMAHTTARKDAKKFATIVQLDQNERFGKTRAAQKDRQLDQQDRKIKLLEEKAAKFEQARGVMENKELSEEDRKLKMRELFGLSLMANTKTISKKDAVEKLRAQIEAARQTAGVPLRDVALEELEKRVTTHTLGQNANGWKNPYPADDPRSLLLEYQFAYREDQSRFKAALMSRQTGKDFSSESEAAEDCHARPRTEWMIAAPSERQALDSLEQGKTWAQGFDLKITDYQERREGGSETLLKSAEIIFSNGSRMRAVPGKPDTVRGRSANILLTEFDFFENAADTWRAILPSITNPLRGGQKKVRLITTPNGAGGAMHKIWTKEDSAKMKWSRHLVTIYHAVLMGLPVDIEELRQAFDDPDGFAQEFLCLFLDGSNVLLPYDLIQLAESMDATEMWSIGDSGKSHPTFCGIDFGRTNDPTVCWTLQQVGDVFWTREVLVLKDVASPVQEQLLKDRIRAATRTCFDYTGPGIGLGDYLVRPALGLGQFNPAEHQFGKIELCTFTTKFKRELFPLLRARFKDAQGRCTIRIPISTTIREDLHEMQQVITNGEYNYWSRRTREGHSDRCTALALANRAAGKGVRHVGKFEVF